MVQTMPKKKPPYRMLNLYLPRPIADKLDARARAEKRSRSNCAAVLLEHALQTPAMGGPGL